VDQLWKPYSQVHDKGEVTALGAGLGLYVTKASVESHGGRVGASSPGPGGGSRFWFTLPAAG
jgi:signal transduction histidine kinase